MRRLISGVVLMTVAMADHAWNCVGLQADRHHRLPADVSGQSDVHSELARVPSSLRRGLHGVYAQTTTPTATSTPGSWPRLRLAPLGSTTKRFSFDRQSSRFLVAAPARH